LITRTFRFMVRSPSPHPPSARNFTPHLPPPHWVTLMQLRFTSFAVINLRRDFHPQECAHAGRTIKKTRKVSLPGFRQSLFNLCLAIPFFTLFPVFSPYPESPLWFSKPYRRSEKYSKSRIPPAALPPPGSHSEPVRRYRSSCRFSWLC